MIKNRSLMQYDNIGITGAMSCHCPQSTVMKDNGQKPNCLIQIRSFVTNADKQHSQQDILQ